MAELLPFLIVMGVVAAWIGLLVAMDDRHITRTPYVLARMRATAEAVQRAFAQLAVTAKEAAARIQRVGDAIVAASSSTKPSGR